MYQCPWPLMSTEALLYLCLLLELRMAISQPKIPHFVLLPFMAQGHMIPMVDIARLLAKRGVIVTILTTQLNESRFKNVIQRAIHAGLDIRVLHLNLPCVEAGLPQGCENFDMLRSMDDAMKFFTAVSQLKDQVQEILGQIDPFPSCLVSDMCFAWSSKLARELQIPRILFHGMCCFSLLCWHLMRVSKEFEAVASDLEYFVLPGLPHRIEITKAQLRGNATPLNEEWIKIRDQIQGGETEAYGIVMNTFQELEPEYVKEYRKVREGKKLWCIGPVSLCNNDELDKAERGNKASMDEYGRLQKWLEEQELGSVIYVCLGSLSRISAAQMVEIGLALKESNRPFIWVIRNASDELKAQLISEEESAAHGGILIHGWAPQVLILSHRSVGGFLTHCGWNSTLEGITAGLPMLTWPGFAEQFCNERLIVNVIGTGVRVGSELPVMLGEEERMEVIEKDEIKRAVDGLMDGGGEGEERRKRARKLAEMARTATEEGGSSYCNISLLVEDVSRERCERCNP